jgi:hypothetical protein
MVQLLIDKVPPTMSTAPPLPPLALPWVNVRFCKNAVTPEMTTTSVRSLFPLIVTLTFVGP